MNPPRSSASEALYRLITGFLAGQLNTKAFCDSFEATYNSETELAALTPQEQSIFSSLFDELVYYSPFPEERTEIASYRSEAQIQEAARRSLAKLA